MNQNEDLFLKKSGFFSAWLCFHESRILRDFFAACFRSSSLLKRSSICCCYGAIKSKKIKDEDAYTPAIVLFPGSEQLVVVAAYWSNILVLT